VKKRDWYLYLIRCADGSLYTGITTEVERRLAQHREPGRGGSKYLAGRGPLALVWQKKIGDYSSALKAEHRVKKLPKDKKESLIHDTHLQDEILEPRSQLRCFDPIIDEKARVLILGSMPGKVSLEKGQYYAHPLNRFWNFIYTIFETEPETAYEAKTAFLKSRQIALWDVIKTCQRSGSADSNIINPVINDFETLLRQHPGLKYILFNGKKAGQLFKKHLGHLSTSGLQFNTLPSTSPANAGLSREDKLKEWRVVKELTGSYELRATSF
jgi:hypoxanthine-DNA glycosylase